MPSGTWKSTTGASFSASAMNSLKIGAARPPPVEPLAQRLRLVEAHVEPDDEVDHVAYEPRILFVVRGARRGDRTLQFEQRGGGARGMTPSIIDVI